jgi:DNA primase
MTRVNFDYVKEHADFTAVLEHYNITTIWSGDQVRIKCPFHDDDNPSCSVNLTAKVFNCKAGSCGKHGNVLHFVQEIEGCDIRQAAITLAEICGIQTSAPAGGAGKPTGGRNGRRGAKAAPEAAASSGGAPAAKEADFDREGAKAWLSRNPLDTEHPYLVERIGRDAMQRFEPCGYAGSKGVMRGRAVLGLSDPAGELVGFLGRWTGDLGELPETAEKYSLPKGFPKSRYLYGLDEEWVQRSQWLVVVEGAFSVIRLQLEAVFPAVGLLGSTVSEHQIALLREHCPRLRQIVVLMDGDEAGRKAADVVAPLLARAYPTRIVDLPEGAEPDTVDLGELRGLLNLRNGPN